MSNKQPLEAVLKNVRKTPLTMYVSVQLGAHGQEGTRTKVHDTRQYYEEIYQSYASVLPRLVLVHSSSLSYCLLEITFIDNQSCNKFKLMRPKLHEKLKRCAVTYLPVQKFPWKLYTVDGKVFTN